MHGFTPEQVQQPLSLIETPRPGFEKLSGKNAWLFDSRASYHMTGELSCLNNVIDIDPIPVRLENGFITYVVKRESVKLNPKLTLHDVLYVPSLDCNLISVAQLLDGFCCMVTFFKKLCVIQDLATKNLIGVGEPRKGVFVYKEG